MALNDLTGILKLPQSETASKFSSVAHNFYCGGRPQLRGSAFIRLTDGLMLRLIGNALATKVNDGQSSKCPIDLAKIGRMARQLNRLGCCGRQICRGSLALLSYLVVRQQFFGVNKKTSFVEAAIQYFIVADHFGFDIDITNVTAERITFKIKACPFGCNSNEPVKLLMALGKFSRQCARSLGARMVVEKLGEEGTYCQAYITHSESIVPAELRLYRRYRV